MKRVILVFTVMLICMMASSAFSTEARPYDPTRPRLSPGGDDFPWDDYRKVATDENYLNSNGDGEGGSTANTIGMIQAITGFISQISPTKSDCLKGNARKKSNTCGHSRSASRE